MRPSDLAKLDRDLREYLETLTEGYGMPCRRSMGWYVTGLLLDGERKSMQPMAARLVDDPAEVEAMRQRLQECVVISRWDECALFARLAPRLDRELPGIEALVVDDTGFPKKGTHSVGVARQYSGTLGRIDNCQVAVSLHVAGEQTSGCIGMKLFLPEIWIEDEARRKEAGIPNDLDFRRKWEIALALVDDALEAGVRRHLVLADPGYGDSTEFRDGLRARNLPYLVGVQGNHRVFPPDAHPSPPPGREGKAGRPRTYWTADREPVCIDKLALQIGRAAYRRVVWREGSRGKQASHFAALRVVPAENYRRGKAREPQPMHWLIIEWPLDEKEPTKYWFSDLPEGTSIVTLVRLAKLRWRVERDYQEMKAEVGLDHYEGRTWRGFHHHIALCALAHGFLALQRALFPPEEEALDTPAG